MVDNQSILGGMAQSIDHSSKIVNSILKQNPMIYSSTIMDSVILDPNVITIHSSIIQGSKIQNFKTMTLTDHAQITDSQLLDISSVITTTVTNCSIISAGLMDSKLKNVTLIGCGDKTLRNLNFNDCFIIIDNDTMYVYDLVFPVFLQPLVYRYIIESKAFQKLKHRRYNVTK